MSVIYPNLNCCCFYFSTFIVVVVVAFRVILLHRNLQEFLQFWTVCRDSLCTTSANVRIYCLFNWKKPTDFRSKEQNIECRYRLGKRVIDPCLVESFVFGSVRWNQNIFEFYMISIIISCLFKRALHQHLLYHWTPNNSFLIETRILCTNCK